MALSPLLVAMAFGACNAHPTPPTFPLEPKVLDVRLEDNRFEYQDPIPAGRVVFRVQNVGGVEHELQLFPLSEQMPSIDDQLRGSERRILNPLGGVPHRRPGQGGVFASDLVVGQRYAMICFLRNANGSHALQGMASEFRAIDPAAVAPSTTER